MTLSTLRVYSFEKWYLRPTIKSAANYCKLMKFEHLVRQMDFRNEERKNQITSKDKQDTSSATGAPTEYSRKAKVPFRELKWNYSVCFTNGKFPPHFLWFFILTHKLMFCKQMNPNTRRTFTKFVINRIKTIFGTACFDMCMIFTSVLHRLSQYMNAVNTDRMVLACFVSWRLCIWVLQIGFLLSRPPKQVDHIPEKLVC